MDLYLKEIQRLQKLYDEVEEDNIDLESDPESDRCEESDHNTESEEELEEELATPEYFEFEFAALLSFKRWGILAKTCATKKKYVRTRSCQIISYVPGTKENARQAVDPLGCWKCFVDDNIIETIVQNTNIFISKVRNNYTDPNKTKPTKAVEIKVLIGLLYLAGVFKAGRRNCKNRWDGRRGVQSYYGPQTICILAGLSRY